jgi:hypothetical protein
MAIPQSLPPSTTPTSNQTPLILPSSAPMSPFSNNAEPILPTSSDNMNPSPIRLSVPAQVHLPDVYASSSAAKRGGSFEIMNEGEQTIKVDLEKRGVEVEFWASPPPEGEKKHGELLQSQTGCTSYPESTPFLSQETTAHSPIAAPDFTDRTPINLPLRLSSSLSSLLGHPKPSHIPSLLPLLHPSTLSLLVRPTPRPSTLRNTPPSLS